MAIIKQEIYTNLNCILRKEGNLITVKLQGTEI